MYDKTTIALTMHCRLNTSANRCYRKPIVDFVQHLLGHMPQDAPSDALDEAINVVTPDLIALHMKQVLSNPGMIDEAIEDEFYTLKPFVVTDRPWSQTFIRERIYHSVVQTLERQFKAGSFQFTPAILHAGFLLISAFVEALSRSRTGFMEDLVTNTSILAVASDGLVIVEKNGTDDWIHLFEAMVSFTRCVNPECAHRATPRFLISCQTKLERLYIPIRDNLDKIGVADSKALATWRRFADCVGVSELLLLAKWIRKVQCCNPHCPNRATKKKHAKLLKCARCQSVYYHGKTCQREDWKHHKRQCKRAQGVL